MPKSTTLPSSAPAFLKLSDTDAELGQVSGTQPAKIQIQLGAQNLEFAESQLENYLRDRKGKQAMAVREKAQVAS